MKEELTDVLGTIKMVDIRRGFGFLSSSIENKEYYFKIKSLQESVNPFDEVAFIIKTANNREVADAIRKVYTNEFGVKFIPRINRHHIHNGVEPYLPNIYEKIKDLSEERIVKDFEFPFVVGKTICVETDSNDVVFYAIRKGRLGHTRFVLNREPEDCKRITIVLRKISIYYQLISCYIGVVATYEPWDIQASLNDLDFWKCHALISGEEDIINESRTYDCPWVLNQPAICKVKL